MLPIAKMGDKSSHGGTIVTGNIKGLINGVPVACVGDLHLCAIDKHASTPIITGSSKAFIDGRPVARLGDSTACGATIISGDPTALTE